MLKTLLIRIKLWLLSLLWRVKYRLFPERLPINSDGKVYLHLGAGNKASPEFINIDAVPFKHTHHVQDISDLSRFPSGSVDMIYASHVIEHLPRKKLVSILSEWRRVLKAGGVLRFGVPDFDRLIEMYQASDNDVESVVNQLMGQDSEYDDHHSIWNRAYAESILKRAGFSEVRAWDPESVDHHEFTDKTNRAYEIGGRKIPFSLNLEAVA